LRGAAVDVSWRGEGKRHAMGVPFLDQGPMRVEEFYAFTATRPDEEKWELIDGEPLLNPTPSYITSSTAEIATI
jgi:hypothetical protein